MISCHSFVLVCLVSQLNCKVHLQCSQHVYSDVVISGAEEKVVNFVFFLLENISGYL